MSQATLVLGKVWTGNTDERWIDAFYVENGVIQKTGSKADVVDFLKDREYDVLDFGKNMVMPGMADGHMHLTAYAKQSLYLDLSAVESLEELAKALREHVQSLPKGTWIRTLNYNDKNWSDGLKPDIQLLDSIAPDHPVLLSRYCGHIHVANTLALKQAGMWDSNDPYIIRGENGAPTGYLTEGAAAPILEILSGIYESYDSTVMMLEKACLELASHGITSVHACDAPSYALEEDMVACQDLYEKNRLPLRVVCYFDRLPNYNIKSGFGNDMLSFGGYKLFADGNLGGHTCAVREPFSDEPENCGVLNHSDEELYALVKEAQQRKIQIAIHSIGDRALEQVVSTLERITAEIGAPELPYRIIHAIICPPDLLERMKKLNLVIDTQIIQVHTDRSMAPVHVGSDRISHCYAYKKIHTAGVVMTCGSDAPVENPNPWLGIWAAVNVADVSGKMLMGRNASDRLTLEEALEIYTVNSWKALRKENAFGLIKEGYRADFTVVHGDPFEMDPLKLYTVEHLATFVDGACTWKREK